MEWQDDMECIQLPYLCIIIDSDIYNDDNDEAILKDLPVIYIG